MWLTLVGRRMPKVRALYPFLVWDVVTEGTTGKETRGYDPSQDIVWLRSEIVRWVQGNLMEKWYVYSGRLFPTSFNIICRGSIKRRHQATSVYALIPTNLQVLTRHRGKPSRNTASSIFRLRKYLTNSGSMSRPSESQRTSRRLV